MVWYTAASPCFCDVGRVLFYVLSSTVASGYWDLFDSHWADGLVLQWIGQKLHGLLMLRL
jgi:hypothetical protein